MAPHLARLRHQVGELLVRRVDREVVGRHPAAALLPTPVRRDERHLREVLLPVLRQPALNALRVGQPFAPEPNHRRPVFEPSGQIAALRKGRRAPRLRQRPRLVEIRRIAPVGRRAVRAAASGHHDVVSLRVRTGRKTRAGPAELHAGRRAGQDQIFGIPLAVLRRGVEPRAVVVVTAERRRQIAGLASRAPPAGLHRPGPAENAAFGGSQHGRVVLDARAQLRGQRHERILHLLKHPAVPHLHGDAPARHRVARLRPHRANHAGNPLREALVDQRRARPAGPVLDIGSEGLRIRARQQKLCPRHRCLL